MRKIAFVLTLSVALVGGFAAASRATDCTGTCRAQHRCKKAFKACIADAGGDQSKTDACKQSRHTCRADKKACIAACNPT